jgi:hypothetical protein
VKFSPRHYQDLGIDWILDHPKAAVFGSPGVGKTVISLTAIHLLAILGDAKRTLIVAPKRVKDTAVWSREVSKWDHLSWLNVVAISGTQQERLSALDKDADVYVIHYDVLPWLIDLNVWFWDTLILDESHKLKNYKGAWFKKLKTVVNQCRRVVCLTGTPAPNSVADLWSQVFLLDGGKRLGKNITSFRKRWMRQGYDGFSWKPLPHAEREVADAIADICLTIKASDYLDLPDMMTNVIPVHLDAKTMKQHRELERDFLLHFEDGVVEASNAAVLSGKLLQHAAGFLYREDGTTWEDVHTAKLAALDDFREEYGKPFILAYKYKADLQRITEHHQDAVRFDGKPATIAAFQRGEIPILLMQPAGDSEGTDGLQDGTDTMLFYGLDWSLKDHDQIIERIGPTRQLQSGHPRPVWVHYLASQGTVDELVLQRLIEKKSVQEIILNRMKRL